MINDRYYKPTFISEFFSSTRLKSFIWRAGAVGLVAIVGYAQTEITNLQLSETSIVLIGLVLGEITKALNNVIQSR
jgi:hypothetical protein